MTENRNRTLLWRLVAATASMAILVVATNASAADQPTKIRFGNSTGIVTPTLIIAQERGLFKKENIELENINLNGSGPIAEALASNNLDFGNASPTTTMLAIAKGAKVKLVSGFEYTFVDKAGRPWEAVFVAVRPNEGLKTLKDLAGKRIAVNDIGSIYNYMLRHQFKQLGLDMKKDLIVVPVPFGQMAGVLIQKQVDAAVATADAVFQMRERIPVDLIASHSSLEGSDIGMTASIGISPDIATKNPAVVERFLKAMLEARRWMDKANAENNPELFETIARVAKFSPERAKTFWEGRAGYYGKDLAFINMLDIPERLVKRQLEILESAELLPNAKAFGYANFVDISYLRKAYGSLGMTWDDTKH